MTRRKKPVSRSTSPEATATPVLLGSGIITPGMLQTLDNMKNFKGSGQQAEDFFGNAVGELLKSALSQMSTNKET